MQPAKIEISHKTIVFTAMFIGFLWFLFKIRYVLLTLFIGLIFMSALSPIVDKMQKGKIPRALAIFLLYAVIISFISFAIASLVPPLAEQTGKFISQSPAILSNISKGKLDISIFESQLISLPQQAVKIIVGAFNNVVALFTFLVIVFYMIMERRNLHKYLVFIFGDGDKEARAEAFINKLEHKLGSWVRGQLSLMFIVGILSYIGLKFLDVEFAIPLAFIAGLLEIIPNIGPTIAVVPAALVAFGHSPTTALAVLALYLLIQQLENNIIVPKVLSKAVGLKPLVVIIALLTGYKTANVAGAILAIPLVLSLEILITELYSLKGKK